MSMKLITDTLFGTVNCLINLYAFQATCVEWMKGIEYNIGDPRYMAGGILANDMGMGKTPTTAVLIASTFVPSTLILTTPSTRYEWIKNLILAGIIYTIYTVDDGKVFKCTMERDNKGVYKIVQTPLNKKRGEEFIEPCIMVCNYYLVTTGTVNNKIITDKTWWRIVIDEAAFLRNQNDSWIKLDNLRQPISSYNGIPVRLGSRWCITGTPIQNGGKQDLVNIFRWVDNRFLVGKSEREWSDELQKLIGTNLFRVNRDQVTQEMKAMMQYPDKDPIVETVNITLPESEYSKWLEKVPYEYLREFCSTKDSSGNLTQQAQVLLEKILTDERCFMLAKTIEAKYFNANRANGSLLEDGEFRSMISYPYVSVPDFIKIILGNQAVYRGSKCKMDKLREMLKSNQSFVCFHHYENIGIEIGRTVREQFPTYTVLEINGGVKSDLERHNIVEQANGLIDMGYPVILISSTMATAEGMNYQKFSRIIMFDHEYNQKTDEQAKARVQRIGQKNQVYIYEFTLQDFNTYYGVISVDKRIQDIRDSRKHLSDILDNYNAAFAFKRYTCPIQDQQTGLERRESGVYFGDYWERQMKGMMGGVDSVGPLYVN